MRKKMWSLFMLLMVLIPSTFGLFSNQPRFRSDNGHLCIESATNHNISLITKGQGYINVNNENLLQIIGMAKDAWDTVESFRSMEIPAFADSMKNILPMIDGTKSLSNRVTALEMQMLNGTAMAMPTKGKGGTIQNARMALRLTNLEKKVTHLINLLSISECQSNPCQNGGTCMDLYNRFQCNCPRNWQGRLCELDVDECVRFANTDLGCQNGAECKNTAGSYECLCAPNWYGLHCTKKKNDCNSVSSAEFCGNGICINHLSTLGGYTCICNQGWTTDGSGTNPACTKDVDECKENKHTCSSNPPVECKNTRGSFTCGNCPIGYEGDGFVCTDINECLVDNGGCSINPKVQCINSRGSFKCEPCPPGYSGDGRNCLYVSGGACAINNGGCHPKADCTVYAETTIQCTCRQGYKGSGYGINGCVVDSTSVDLCANRPCGLHGSCIANDNHSFSCLCNRGFTGKMCNISSENVCFENPCFNGECVTGIEPGDFSCKCFTGYSGFLCDSVKEACSGYLISNSGMIRYPEPNTSLTYASNLNCGWTIEVNSSFAINLTFIWIDVEKSVKCTFDYIEILSNDEDGPSLGTFCGNNASTIKSTISDSNMVIVRFHTDGSKNFGGFQLNYTSIQPKCGGSFDIDSHGTLSSPGSPGKYPNSRDCYWTLNAKPGKRIQFNFFSLQFEQHLNCSFDYLEIRDGFTHHSPMLIKLCNTTIPPPIYTSGAHASLHFHSDVSGQDYGFQMTYTVIEGIPGCGGIYTSPDGIISSPVDLSSDSNNYLDNLNCEWHIRMPLNQKIKLSFIKNFGIESSKNCTLDFLEIYDGPNLKSPIIGRYCGSDRFYQPIITNSNEVTLFFKSDFATSSDGFKIKYEILCGGTFTENKGVLESPFYPNPYPNNRECIYIIAQPVGKAIRLSFLDLDIEDLSYPKCLYDSLEIRDGDNENSTKIATLCGNFEKLPKLPYISTHNYMWLKFSTDNSNNNKGFRANYSTIDMGCGGILKDSSGIIQSSKHPDQYLHNQMCKWIISVNESSQIQLTWLTFSLESQLNCNNDYVEIYDNSISGNASKIARYCGTKVPPVLTSMGNRLTIIFKTDHSVALDGFMLSYITLNKAQACGGNFFTPEGFIKSPNFPEEYPKLKDCIWTITVPVFLQIELNISEFLLEESLDCRFDFLEIRNGGYSTSPLIGKYCGSKILPIISSMGNSLFIRFVSDGSRGRKGFIIQWYITNKGCGGTLNSGMGHIVSPNYPLPVQETLECFYKIAVAQGNQIKLTIVDLELTTETLNSQTCKDDFLEFYDGGNTASKPLGTFCSDTHSATLVHSSSNQMYIKFRSGGFSKGRGFSLKYSTDCNVTLKGYQGAIEIARQENMRTDKCQWTIIAPKGNKVNITFTSFRMISSRLKSLAGFRRLVNNECNSTNLSISEGAYIDEINTVLWNYCMDNPPPLISSTKSVVRINYNFRNKLFLDTFDTFRLEWITDGCGGTLNKFRGEFKSPGYPGFYSSSISCEWKIITDYGNTIEIVIEDFSFETTRNCAYDSLTIYSGADDTGSELLRICHTQKNPITITSGGNEVFVRFESDEQSQSKGFKASYMTMESKCGGKFTAPQGTIHSSNYPQNYDSSSSCMWYIEIAETHLVNLTFVDFSTRNFPAVSRDSVLVYDGDINGKLLLNHSGNSIPPPIISSSNKLLVSFEVGKQEMRAKGFKAIYSTACGAKLITNESGIINSNSLEYNSLPRNCSWTIISGIPDSKVTLTFTHIDIVHYLENALLYKNKTNVECSHNLFHTIFRILDGPDQDAPEIIKFCKSYPIPGPIVSNGPSMRIEYSQNSNLFDSFMAIYSVRSIACGGTYETIRGTISTPNYPNNYLRDSECVWILKSSVGNRISINFISFELEETEFCNEVYVEVREQNITGPHLGTFCGSNIPPNNITGSSLWIKFRSSSLGTAKGFTANFHYVNENYLTQKSGEISSPNYPKMYRSVEDYSWTIAVDEGKRLQIVIKELTVLSQILHLKIYDGSSFETLVLFELDPSDYVVGVSNKTIISSDNIVIVKLIAGSKSTLGMSFLISWTETDQLHSKILYPEFEIPKNRSSNDYYLSPSTNTSVIITSPGYPYGYAPNLHAVWTIHTDPHYHLEIELIDVDLSPMHSSSEIFFKDYITVETVDSAGTTMLQKTFKNTNQDEGKKIVGKNKIIITFISNNALNGTGFKAEAKLKCGGELSGPNGVIEVSNTTIMHESDLVCTWNVTVRSGKTISVKFIDMKLLYYTACQESYILLKNGFYEDSSLVGQGKYCNKPNVTELSTTDNKLQVQVKISTQEMVKIEFEEKSVTCGGQIYLSNLYNTTEITSPSYPNIPSPHIECIWTIVAPAGERLFVNIEDINLKIGEACEKEYVEFRNGAARFSPLIKRICRYFEVYDIETTDNFLYIKYFTDLNVPSNGFKINITIAKCGGTRHASRGTISSPNFPGAYEPNMDCEYRIVVDINHHVSLSFDTVNLRRRFPMIGIVNETNNDTHDDSLTIYDVDPINNNKILLSKIFGSNAPSTPIKSSGRELVIKFKSQIKNGPYYVKNIQPKFLLNYYAEYNDCDQHFEADNGEISSPKFSSLHVSQMRCMYTIKVPRGRRVNVELVEGKSITYPCDNQGNVILSSYVKEEKLQAFMGNTFWYNRMMCINWFFNPLTSHYNYESTINEIAFVYEFSGGNQQGFRLKYTSNNPSFCGGTIDANTSTKGQLVLPIQYITSYLCQWDLINTNGTTVIAANFKVNESEVLCRSDAYTLLATDQDEDIMLKAYCLTRNTNDKFLILSPLPMTKLWIRANSKLANYTATIDYSFNSCGGVIQGKKITITSPNYPKNYQQNTNCAWEINLPEEGNVNVNFNDMDLESSCDSNYVKLYAGPGPESPVLGKYCGNILPENLVAPSNKIWVVFSSTNNNSLRKGFNITFESVEIGCGKVYLSENGEITSTNYPKLYPNNDECEWTITVWPGNRVNLQFVERFYLEQSVNCTKDYVQISDYVNNSWITLRNRLCGRQIPPSITSTETKLKVRIRTDDDIQGDGFKAKWNSLCDGIFTQSSGKIVSPNYPRIYPNGIKCNYTIYAPGNTIRLVFKSFELEDNQCKYDNLTIYDTVGTFSNTLTKHLLGSYCGTRVPQTLTILNSVMMIFVTDSSSTHKGFEINYELIKCGGEITTPGLLKSPTSTDELTGYSAYPPNENCTWIIRAPPGQVVQLVFTKFRLESNSEVYNEYEYDKCPYDAVYVFDESDLKSNDTQNVNVFCGIMDNILPEVQSKTNTLYVQFVTDFSRSNEGFVAEISFNYGESKGCGGTLRLNQTNSTSSYTLKAPNLLTRTNLDCGWLILVASSFVVQIQVISYKETPKCSLNTTDCRCSSIQFFDGPGRMNSKIRQFCPDNIDNPIVTSSGSEAYLRYMVFETDVDVNFEIKITPVTSICGPRALLVSNQTQVLTSPNYPLPYDNDLICTWSLEMESSFRFLLLRFIDVDLGETKDCSTNYLEVHYNQWMNSYFTTFQLCHEDHEFDFWGQKLLGPVKLKLHTNGQKTSKGFKLEYKSIICQPTYDKPNGRIYFEYVRDSLPGGIYCTFTINVRQPNLTINAYFSTANFLGLAANNYLKVYDGPSVSSPLIATLVESEDTPPPMFSTGPALTMTYKSSFRWSLMDISYISTDQGRGCGGRIFNVEGVITSPLYPLVYRKIATCRWDIAVPRPHPVSIAFRVFNLGERKTCDTDYLELYNVDQITGKSSFVAKYCGGDNPALHISQTGAVFIRYVTTVHNTGTGWVLSFKLKPNF